MTAPRTPMPIAYLEAFFAAVTASAVATSLYLAAYRLWQASTGPATFMNSPGNLLVYAVGMGIGSWFIALSVGALPYTLAARYAHRHGISSPFYYLGGALLTTTLIITSLMVALTCLDPRDATTIPGALLHTLPLALPTGTAAGLTAWLWLRRKSVLKTTSI